MDDNLIADVLLPISEFINPAHGYCFGMASTAILYKQYPNIKPVLNKTTYHLEMGEAQDKIVEYQIKQYPWYLDTIWDSTSFNRLLPSSPSAEFNSLSDYLQNQHKPAMLIMSGTSGSHAVVAYNIIDNGNTKTVQIYDNNYPYDPNSPNDSNRTVEFNLSANTFTYEDDPYSYDRVFVRYPTPDYQDNPSPIIQADLFSAAAVLNNMNLIQIGIHSPVTGLFVDDQGHKFGSESGVFVNEIPSAKIIHLGEETVFYLPNTSEYTLTTTGTSAATGSATMGVDITQPTSSTLTKWISYTRVPVTPGSTATLNIGAENTDYTMQLSFGNNHIPDVVYTIDDDAQQVSSSATLAPETAAITLSSASADVTTGKPFTVDVQANGRGEAFNAAKATVAISSNLAVTSLTTPSSNACNFTYTQAPTVSSPSFEGAIFGSSKTSCTVYRLTLVPTSSGTGTITINNASLKAYADSTELNPVVQNGSYSIINAPTPTPTPVLTQLTVTSTADTYNASFVLTGTKDADATSVFVNGSTTGVTFPTSTTWQKTVSLSSGTNQFVLYSKDDNGNQTATIRATVKRHTLGDINGDGVVDIADYSLFAADWGKTSNLTNLLSDMDGDSAVDLTDYSILAKEEAE